MIHVSAIICTFNRAELLTKAVGSLVHQTLDTKDYEIIVVDNASTDETAGLIGGIQGRYPEHRIVRIYEARQGLGYARNAGLADARGKYVAYLDDDAFAEADWLETALELFDSVKPTPVCVGGQIIPFYNTARPRWFKDAYETRTMGDRPRFLNHGEPFPGSNMSWERGFLRSLGGFDERVGVKGAHLSLGEETMPFYKAWSTLKEPVFYYSPRLLVHHWVPPYKMTVSYHMKRIFVAGQVWSLQDGPKSLGDRLMYIADGLLAIPKLCNQVFKRRRVHTHWENWLIEDCKPIFVKVGAMIGVSGLIVPIKQL